MQGQSNLWGTSFHPLKNLNGIGDGGMLLTSKFKIYKNNEYRNHGLVSRDNVEDFGVNLDVIHAEILKFRLKIAVMELD